ncbi:Uncharacterised protein [Candidatus Norongarragalina meridionalis]|nr:Uncharacterised protein [Candidatus Norongarragalina meridionalis]
MGVTHKNLCLAPARDYAKAPIYTCGMEVFLGDDVPIGGRAGKRDNLRLWERRFPKTAFEHHTKIMNAEQEIAEVLQRDAVREAILSKEKTPEQMRLLETASKEIKILAKKAKEPTTLAISAKVGGGMVLGALFGALFPDTTSLSQLGHIGVNTVGGTSLGLGALLPNYIPKKDERRIKKLINNKILTPKQREEVYDFTVNRLVQSADKRKETLRQLGEYQKQRLMK